MAAGEENWRSSQFRQNIVSKLEEAIQMSAVPSNKNAMEMENQVFQRAKTKEEYLSFVARLILHVREINSKKVGAMAGNPNHGMQDPINALQNLARQGTGNQMMGLPPPPVPQQPNNSNILQALNPRPVISQKHPPPQGAMMSLGGGLGPGLGTGMVGSPLSQQQVIQQMGQAPPQQRKVVDGMIAAAAGGPQYTMGPRGMAPNQYLRQSPPPVSGAQPSQPQSQPPTSSNQMVASPALVPSPGQQMGPNMGPASLRGHGMAASPGSSCLNTPGGAGTGATPSPGASLSQEEIAYREKVCQLRRYIEPVRRMMTQVDGRQNIEKLSKLKNLMDILSNPNKRVGMDTLLKCEVVLEKMDLKRTEAREQHPLIEALKTHLSSPVINHTLQRTFGPCMEALFGTYDIKFPPMPKKRKIEETVDDIPEVLQGEIARLDQRFKVSLDPSQIGSVGSRSVELICWLDDRHLPCVPAISLTVPENYPSAPPTCHLTHHTPTTFLSQVQSALELRVAKLPAKYTVSQLLDTWEMSVRQACAPSQVLAVSSTVNVPTT